MYVCGRLRKFIPSRQSRGIRFGHTQGIAFLVHFANTGRETFDQRRRLFVAAVALVANRFKAGLQLPLQFLDVLDHGGPLDLLLDGLKALKRLGLSGRDRGNRIGEVRFSIGTPPPNGKLPSLHPACGQA